ncbi:hypothetical protein FGB62_34g013 [Gracilaria domingensis]|nr:hypothetical protein FGB62_34g013 [Gracilaria domingensis]
MRRQHPCDSCARKGKVQVSQYRCPACLRCSCSLACVKDHKQHYNCSGVRDKTAPVPKRDYDEHNLVSDYSLLEDAKRKKDEASRNRAKNFYNPRAPQKLPDPIPRHKQRLMGREAAKRGIDLRFMPNVFYRHRRNTSHIKPVDYSNADEKDGATTFEGHQRPFDKIMVWRVDVQFSGTDGGIRLVEIHDLDEEANMNDVLERAVKALHIRKEPRLNGAVDPYLQYSGLPASQLNTYIKNEISLGARRAQPSSLPNFPKYKRRKTADGRVDFGHLELDTRAYILVNTDKTLRESLHSALVVEHPILYVAPKGSQEDKELAQGTKSLFDKPEPEADDSIHPPASRVNLDEFEDEKEVKEGDANISEPQASSATHVDSASAPAPHSDDQLEPNLEGEIVVKQNDDNGEHRGATLPVPEGDEKIERDVESRGVKRKAMAESSDDDESDLSELERNITKRFTPKKKTGGKTGWTRDGKVRTVNGKRPATSVAAVPMPRFRSVLPPAHFGREERAQGEKKETQSHNEVSAATSEPKEFENENEGRVGTQCRCRPEKVA